MRCKVALFVAYETESLRRKFQPVLMCGSNLYLPSEEFKESPETEIEIKEIPSDWVALKEVVFEAFVGNDSLLYLKLNNGKEIPVAVSDETADVIGSSGGYVQVYEAKNQKGRWILIPVRKSTL